MSKARSYRKSMQQTYLLDESSLDEVVLAVQQYAESKKVDASTANKYSFFIDNALDYWLQHGGRGKEIKVTFGRRLFTPFISIELDGEKIDPYPINSSDFGNGGSEIAVIAAQLPEYEYQDGVNTLFLRLKRQVKLVHRIIFVAVAAVIIGTIGNLLMPESFRSILLTAVIGPIVNMFFNLLRCIAGPMVFLSVIWGICGIGDTRIFGRVGKSVLLFSVGVTALGAVVGAFTFPFLGSGFSADSVSSNTFSSLFDMILGIVPSNIVEPFSVGNTLQIIFLAIAIGLALIARSNKVRGLFSSVDQFYILFQQLQSIVSQLVPFIVFLLIVQMIWEGSLSLILKMWKFFVAMILSFLAIILIICVFTSVRNRVSFLTVVRKNLSTFLISFTTASSSASFSSNMETAKKGYGISDEMAGFSIPLGLIMHNPIAACYDILLAIYFANAYGVSVSIGWLVIGIIVCTIVAVSTPPIPGGGAISYALLFSQLGIPNEALAVVLVLDVITDFVVTAFECYVLPISLVNIARPLGHLKINVLRRKAR